MKHFLTIWSVIFLFSTVAISGSIGYWQLDGATDSLDSILAHGTDDYLDLTVFGTLSGGASAQDPLANPSGASWRWQAGDGDPNQNSGSQFFDAGAGWYLSPMVSSLYFDNDSSFTAECWLRTGPDNGYIMGNRHADSYNETSGWFTGWQLWATSAGQKLTVYTEGNPSLAQGGVTSEVVIETTISRNTWYHAAVVWDHDDSSTGTIKLYLDGVLVDSAPGDTAWSGVTGGSWAIGQRNLWVDESDLGLGTVWGQTGFNGNIDEVRYVDEALSPDQFLNGSVIYQPVEDIVKFGDIDIDNDVDMVDFAAFAEQWRMTTHPSEPDAIQL